MSNEVFIDFRPDGNTCFTKWNMTESPDSNPESIRRRPRK